MPNPYFQFKQFTVYHDRCAMKVTTDACLFGAWCAREVSREMGVGSRESGMEGGEMLRDRSQESGVNGQWSMGREADESKGSSESEKSMVNGQWAMGNSEWSMAGSVRLLDIGTGTGLLSLMVAQKNRVCIDAVEIDQEAAEQAAENVKASSFAGAITVHHSDITEWSKGPYDIIISNPPFYEKEISSSQQHKNVAHHGEGLLLEDLFRQIDEKLTDTGTFYLLLPYKRKNDIATFLKRTGLFIEKEVIVHPTVSNPPFRLLLKGRKQPIQTVTETLAVYDASKKYTPAFVSLLKDYYLYL